MASNRGADGRILVSRNADSRSGPARILGFLSRSQMVVKSVFAKLGLGLGLSDWGFVVVVVVGEIGCNGGTGSHGW